MIMALPTMQPYYSSRPSSVHSGTLRVQKLAQQTMAEDARRREWTDKSRYFNMSYVKSQKAQEWSSEKSLRASLEKYEDIHKKKKTSENLERRRHALKELLEHEREVYEREIKDSVSSSDYRASLKSRAEELRSAREQKRKDLAQQKLLDHWKLNCPELRDVKSRQNEIEAHEEWSHQIQDKQKAKQTEMIQEQRYYEQTEKDRIIELKKQEEREKKKKREQEELSLELRKQMNEVRAKEEESILIEQEQANLIEEQRQLYKAEGERRLLQEEQQKTEFRRILLKQAKAKLRRRCQQIQESLALDLKILQEMAEREEEEQQMVSARVEKQRRDAAYMKRVMEEQMATEKQREKELDMLYQEEAARMWQKREEQWMKEREARERLMGEVMAERQKQLQEKMEQLKILEEETIHQREELLRQIEQANASIAKENVIKEKMEKERQKEIRDQITERQRRREENKIHKQLEEKHQRITQEQQDSLIQEQIQQITNRQSAMDGHSSSRQNSNRVSSQYYQPPYGWY